jgi:glutamine synthetase
VRRELEPPAPCDAPYETESVRLPASLSHAIDLARRDNALRDAFGSAFVEYLSAIKEFEISRFMSEVTEWEQREYFEMM